MLSAHELEADGDARAEQPPQGNHAGDSAPDHHFRVLPSGRLAFRLPDTKAGKQVWLDVVRRVKLCACGHSMIEMHHWRCAARPRACARAEELRWLHTERSCSSYDNPCFCLFLR